MTRHRGSPGRRAPRIRRGPYYAPQFVDVVDVAPACCACCGNRTDDPRCVQCVPRGRDVGDYNATPAPTDPSRPLAKAEGAGAGVLLVLAAIYFATQS